MRLRVFLPEQVLVWDSPGAAFRVGRGETCALRFEGEAAKFASWEHAEFSQDGQGAAHIRDLESSNGTYVDGSRITGLRALRVGAVVQIGRAGPRLEVLSLALSVARPVPVYRVGVPSAPEGSRGSRFRGRRRTSSATVVLIALAAVLVAAGLFLASRARSDRSQPDDAAVAQTKPRANSEKAKKADGGNRKTTRRNTSSPIEPPLLPPPDTLKRPVNAGQPYQRALAAYRLIVVEDPQAQASWPLAGSVVVAERAVLTTATVAVELTKYLDRGFNVAVMQPPRGEHIKIGERRVHAAFERADPAEQLFFDVALLYAEQRLSDAVELASDDEPRQLEQGLPVIGAAVEHDFETIDRFQDLAVQSYRGKIFAVTGLPPQPGPRLLHLRGAFSDKCAGGPIVDEQGRLIAVYCEPAPSEGATAGLALHYAKVIEPALIARGLDQPDDSIWVRLSANTSTKEAAK